MTKPKQPKLTTEKCQSAECGNVAVVLVMWPGQPTKMCAECMQKAQRVNSFIGGPPLPIMPIDTPMAVLP